MPELKDLIGIIWGPFAQVLGPQGNLYWLYLIASAGIALLLYWLRRRGGDGASVTGFFAVCFPNRIYAHRSAQVDFKYFAINTLLFGALVGPLLLTSAVAAQGVAALLISLFGVPNVQLAGGVWFGVAVTIVSVLAADLAFFVSHHLRHRVPILWEFHKVHHSAEVLQPLTAFRSHPVDDILDATLMGAAIGGVLGVSAYLCGTSIDGVTFLGTNAVVFLFNMSGTHLRHSHVWLSYGPVLDRIFVSPAVHQVHHSRAAHHLGKNLGGMFAIWDWLAGTLYLPRKGEDLLLGLANGEHREYASVTDLYVLPLTKIARRLRRLAVCSSCPTHP